MDRWYAWIERRRLYGRFLRWCVWASAPFDPATPKPRRVFLRIGLVALVWSVAPLCVFAVATWAVVSAAGASPDEQVLMVVFACLGCALIAAPIVPRAGLMPIAWYPAALASLLGNRAPGQRIFEEMQIKFAAWRADHG